MVLESLCEFTWFTQWMQNSARWLSTFGPSRWISAVGPPVGSYETTPTITICDYTARRLILILPFHYYFMFYVLLLHIIPIASVNWAPEIIIPLVLNILLQLWSAYFAVVWPLNKCVKLCFSAGWDNTAVHCRKIGQKRFLRKIRPIPVIQSC